MVFINYFKFHTKRISYHKLIFPTVLRQQMGSSKLKKKECSQIKGRKDSHCGKGKGLSMETCDNCPTPSPAGFLLGGLLQSHRIYQNPGRISLSEKQLSPTQNTQSPKKSFSDKLSSDFLKYLNVPCLEKHAYNMQRNLLLKFP